LFRGLPVIERDATTGDRPAVNVLIADHYAFEHHHQKIAAFCRRHLAPARGPRLYISPEDSVMVGIPDANDYLSRALLGVAEKTESWFSSGRHPRRWAGDRLRRKLRDFRRESLANRVPIITSIAPRKPGEQGDRAHHRPSDSPLERTCFCGSGKPFKECHGKET
jgi:DNA-directed RNA polymerase specialized sigma24 family protein